MYVYIKVKWLLIKLSNGYNINQHQTPKHNAKQIMEKNKLLWDFNLKKLHSQIQKVLNPISNNQFYQPKILHPTETLLAKQNKNRHCLTLLRDTNSLPSATGSLSVLTTDTETPVMPQTTVVPAKYSFQNLCNKDILVLVTQKV